jgi:hypothetical protein
MNFIGRRRKHLVAASIISQREDVFTIVPNIYNLREAVDFSTIKREPMASTII